jgi:hypothetical protein
LLRDRCDQPLVVVLLDFRRRLIAEHGRSPAAMMLIGREAREIRGLTVEEHINRLGQDLIPLAERRVRVMHVCEATDSLPSHAVERSTGRRLATKGSSAKA